MLEIGSYIFLGGIIIMSGVYIFFIYKKSIKPEKSLKLETII